MNRVLPREVVQAVKVPTTLDSTEWVGNVGKELPRNKSVVCVLLRASFPMCTTGSLPSMSMFCRYLSWTTTIVVLTCSLHFSSYDLFALHPKCLMNLKEFSR